MKEKGKSGAVFQVRVAMAMATFLACFSFRLAAIELWSADARLISHVDNKGSQHDTTHPVEVESMSRPNQGHPTFSVLLHTNDVPRRARIPFDNWQDLAVTTVAVLHQLVIFIRPVAHAQCEPVLVFALQAQGASLKLKGSNLVLDITLTAELALLLD